METNKKHTQILNYWKKSVNNSIPELSRRFRVSESEVNRVIDNFLNPKANKLGGMGVNHEKE